MKPNMRTLIDPMKKTVSEVDLAAPEMLRLLSKTEAKVYLRNGAIISIVSCDCSAPAWSINGYSFIAHGRAILNGELRQGEKVEFL